MSVQSIKPAHMRYIAYGNLKDSLQPLIKKMNSKTTAHSTKYNTKTTTLNKITIDKEAIFSDGKYLFQPISDELRMTGTSVLKFNEGAVYFNNENGDIITYAIYNNDKLETIFTKAKKYLQKAFKNFDNDKIVEKNYVSVNHC